MSVVVTVLLLAALLAASVWTVLIVIAPAVEILPSFATRAGEQGRVESSRRTLIERRGVSEAG